MRRSKNNAPRFHVSGLDAYPTISGIGIDPNELTLPESHLNPSKKENYNNHHICWVKKEFAKCAILQTCRDLELDQYPMLLDQHEWLHARYDKPEKPTLMQAMDRIIAGYECGERLRIGSQNNPTFKELTEAKIISLHKEYNNIAEHDVIYSIG